MGGSLSKLTHVGFAGHESLLAVGQNIPNPGYLGLSISSPQHSSWLPSEQEEKQEENKMEAVLDSITFTVFYSLDTTH